MARPKKHHYVPQFLLRNFAEAGGTRLYAFDKQTDRIFHANMADLAAENHLYNFSLDNLPVTIEPSLAEFESKAANVLREVLRLDNLAGWRRHAIQCLRLQCLHSGNNADSQKHGVCASRARVRRGK